MIHNHMLDDPEGSPSKGYNPNYYNNNNRFQQPTDLNNSMADDPWYTASPQVSPQGNTLPNDFNSYGSNNHTNMSSYSTYNPSYSSYETDDYDNEPPLLEELGIQFDHIWHKTQAVLYLNKPLSEHILDDTDLAGPVGFCLLLGGLMLLAGKVHFGYIYGFSVCGCLGLQGIIALMHPMGLDFWRTCSVLGYCLLPVIFLAFLAILLTLQGWFGLILSILTIAWCTLAATRLIDAKLHLTEQYWLVAYPVMLLYSCFVLITIF